jgi:pimeloyl-ACP methyl ester carboxylesterase
VHGSGPDVVLLHGVTDSALTWLDLRAQLAGARVHAVDLPGHGLSDVPAAPPTPAEMARSVDAYLDAAGVSDAVVVGWSLGAAVSIELAAGHPQRVRALVLLGPAAVPLRLPPALRLVTLPLVGEAMALLGDRPGLRREVMRDTYARGFRPSDAVLDRYFLGWQVAERAAFIRSLLRSLSFDQTYERAARVEVPVRVIHGAEDRLVRLWAGRKLAERLPNAELEVLEGVGHSPHLEKPDALLAAVRSLVAAQSLTAARR